MADRRRNRRRGRSCSPFKGTSLEPMPPKESQHSEVRYALAVLLFREGDWAGCLREVETLLAGDPNHTKARALREQLNSNKHRPQ